jgi:endonuclease/exonuclease/phosphatase family metal-dependent hydrolase
LKNSGTNIHHSLHAMTYNIRTGIGMDNQYDIRRIAEVIRQAGADFVALQEVDSYFSPRSLYEEQVGLLASQLDMYAAYGPNLLFTPDPGRKEQRQYGNAVLSRYPIQSWRNHYLTSYESEQRGALETEIAIGDQTISFYSVHLGLDKQQRLKQVQELIRIAGATPNPVIIGGDFNATPNSEEINAMTAEFHNVFAGSPDALTVPAGDAKETIDYLFVRGKVHTGGEKTVIRALASDHYALLAELSIS